MYTPIRLGFVGVVIGSKIFDFGHLRLVSSVNDLVPLEQLSERGAYRPQRDRTEPRI